jgi:hypothetical protein
VVVVLTGIEDHKHLLVDLVVDSIHLNTLLVLVVPQLNPVQTPVFRGFSNNGVTQAAIPTAEILVLPASLVVNTQISSQQLLLLYHLIILTLVEMVLNIMPEDLAQTLLVVPEL